MNRAGLYCLAVGLLGAAAVLAADATKAGIFEYTATTVAPPRKQGTVVATGIRWECDGKACRASGPWPVPGLGACRALAEKIGIISAYGHPGRSLSAADLARCNQGLATAAAVTAAPAASNGTKPKPGASAAPPTNVATAPGANAPLPTVKNLGPAQLARGFSQRTASFEALQRARQRAQDEAQRRQRAIAERARRASGIYGDDCDDLRANVHPGAAEICDGYDNDCNGVVDEGQTVHAWLDADGDGHGDPAKSMDVCPSSLGQASATGDGGWLVLVGNDCDDRNPDVWHDCH